MEVDRVGLTLLDQGMVGGEVGVAGGGVGIEGEDDRVGVGEGIGGELAEGAGAAGDEEVGAVSDGDREEVFRPLVAGEQVEGNVGEAGIAGGGGDEGESGAEDEDEAAGEAVAVAAEVGGVLQEPPLDNWGLRGGQPASELDLGFKLDV